MFESVSSHRSVQAGATGLAQALAPPPQPAYPRSAAGCGIAALSIPGAWSASLGLMMLLASAFDPNAQAPNLGAVIGWGITLLGLGLGCVAAAVNIYHDDQRRLKRRRWEYERHMERWKIAMQVWDGLYYCGKCDRVTHAPTGQHARSDELHALL